MRNVNRYGRKKDLHLSVNCVRLGTIFMTARGNDMNPTWLLYNLLVLVVVGVVLLVLKDDSSVLSGAKVCKCQMEGEKV